MGNGGLDGNEDRYVDKARAKPSDDLREDQEDHGGIRVASRDHHAHTNHHQGETNKHNGAVDLEALHEVTSKDLRHQEDGMVWVLHIVGGGRVESTGDLDVHQEIIPVAGMEHADGGAGQDTSDRSRSGPRTKRDNRFGSDPFFIHAKDHQQDASTDQGTQRGRWAPATPSRHGKDKWDQE